MVRKNTFESFWARIDTTQRGCWNWPGAMKVVGYGKVRWHGAEVYAHRKAWELINGAIPAGLYVLHRCDNPRCIRPAHLFLGTHLDNMKDMVAKGHVRGSRPVTWKRKGKTYRHV